MLKCNYCGRLFKKSIESCPGCGAGQFIEVESKYKMMQRRAFELGYSRGDIIPVDFSIDINCPIKK